MKLSDRSERIMLNRQLTNEVSAVNSKSTVLLRNISRLPFLILCLTSVPSAFSQNPKGPPKINHEEASDVVVVKIGEPIRLTCPVTSGSHLLVQWKKDGEMVDESWPSFRIGPRTLRVKSATEDLSGIYECMGITGYGTAQHQIKLIVIDPSDQQFRNGGKFGSTSDNDYPSLNSKGYRLAPPRITQVYPLRPDMLKMVGGRVRFKCVATGLPRPRVEWFKNGVRLTSGDTVDLTAPGQVTISGLRTADSGSYECRVSSLLGLDSAQFQLTVQDPSMQRPVIFDGSLRNSTVNVGGRVILQCRVKGPAPMHVKWLRRVEAHHTAAQRNVSLLVEELNHHRYLVLNSSEPMALSKDQFLSHLTLTRVQVTDNGQYVCLAANNGGITFQQSFITVYSNRQDVVDVTKTEYRSHVYVIIIAPVVVAILLAFIAISCLCFRMKTSQCQNETKSDAEASLVGTDKVFLHILSETEKRRPPSREPSCGGPGVCSLPVHHERRFDRSIQQPGLAMAEHTYNRLDPTCSRSSSGCTSYCDCGYSDTWDLQSLYSQHSHTHKHYIY